MVIKAKRIYEPKKEDNFDIQKVLWEAIQKSIVSSTDQTKQLVSEFERMSSDAWVKKLEEKFYQYIKNLRIEKEEIKQDVYKNIENRVNEIWRRVENHEHKEYLTQEDKDECINSARDMVNEAVLKFDNLFKPFLEQLNIKSDKEHSHEEFWQLQLQIEETEEELEHRIEQKADKEHKHEIEDVTWLSTTLKDFAKKDHKHDEYATREELDFINRRRSGWGSPWEKGDPWITDPIILLSRQNFTVDTYSGSNQILEWHREDGTTIVNTYSSNLLQTAVYTLPDTTVVTLTISYDGNDRVISALYS